jgi:hypothetical protein
MSASVDKRVVEMQFNNAQFEQNAQKSLSTISKLTESLKFEGATNGIAGIEKASNAVTLEGIANSLENISSRFNAFGVLSFNVLNRISNAAIDAGVSLVKSLALDSIIDGWNEYELELNSVQTIMAGTGKSADEVYKRLDILNTYADQTVYSFSDMTTSIGKFTNAGVDLDQAVGAIKGIANEAALSGANTNEASRAMYNFAQSLSAGSVKLIDWMSIENANMATAEFKQQLIDTAIAAGTLTDAGDGLYETLEGTTFSVGTFREALSDKWLTSDVLVKTLNDYADATTDIGKRATDAATQIKDVNQLMDVLVEEAGSGWAITWKYIMGDIDQSKELFTNIGNHYQTLMSNMSNARNDILKGWQDLGGRTELINAVYDGVKGIEDVVKTLSSAFKEVFPTVTSEQLFNITKNFHSMIINFQEALPILTQVKAAFKVIFEVISGVGTIAFIAFKSVADNLFNSLTGPITTFGQAIGILAVRLENMFNSVSTNTSVVDDLKVIFFDLCAPIRVVGALLRSFGSIFKALVDKFAHFTDGASGISSILHGLATALTSVNGFCNLLISGINSVTESILNFIKGSGGATEAGKTLGSIFNTVGSGIVDAFGGALATVGNLITSLIPEFKNLGSTVGEVIGNLLTSIKNIVSGLVSNLNLSSIAGAITAIFTVIGAKQFADFAKSFESIPNLIAKFTGFDKIAGVLDSVKEGIDSFVISLKIDGLLKAATALLELAAALLILSSIDIDSVGSTLILLGVALGEISIFADSMGKSSGFFGKTAAGMAILSAAIIGLSVGLKILSTIDMDGVGASLLLLGGALTEIAIFANTISKIAGRFVIVAAGMLIFAAAIDALAVGLAVLAAIPTDRLVQSLGALAAILVMFGTTTALLSGIAFQVAIVSVSLLAFGAGVLAAGVGAMLLVTALVALAAAATTVAAASTILAGAVVAFVVALVTGIAAAIAPITEAAGKIIVGFINGITTQLGPIIESGLNLAISFINGLADGIRNNSAAAMEAIGNLLQAVGETAISFIVNYGPQFLAGAAEWIMNLVSGITSQIGNVGPAIAAIANSVIEGLDKIVTNFKDAAVNAVTGFVQGLMSGVTNIANAARSLAEQAWNALTGALDEHSPSKLTTKAGVWFDQGIINGMNKLADNVGVASYNVGNNAVASMSDALQQIDSMNMSAKPSITPVIDMSIAESSMRQVDTVANLQALKLSSVVDSSFIGDAGNNLNNSIAGLQNATKSVVSELKEEIINLRTDMNSLMNQDSEISMYVDSKKLASTTAKAMNVQLGRLSRKGALA